MGQIDYSPQLKTTRVLNTILQNHENDSVQIKYWVQTLKKGENMFQLIQDFASLKSFKGENKFHKWLSNLNNCIERINSKSLKS